MEFIINIDTRKKSGKKLLEYLKTLSFVKIQEKETDEDKEEQILLEKMLETEKDKYVNKKEIMKLLNQ